MDTLIGIFRPVIYSFGYITLWWFEKEWPMVSAAQLKAWWTVGRCGLGECVSLGFRVSKVHARLRHSLSPHPACG